MSGVIWQKSHTSIILAQCSSAVLSPQKAIPIQSSTYHSTIWQCDLHNVTLQEVASIAHCPSRLCARFPGRHACVEGHALQIRWADGDQCSRMISTAHGGEEFSPVPDPAHGPYFVKRCSNAHEQTCRWKTQCYLEDNIVLGIKTENMYTS